MTSDPIADMLTRIRNSLMARHEKVDIPASKLKAEVARILKEEGYTWLQDDRGGTPGVLRLLLRKSTTDDPGDSGHPTVSKPGRRIYVNKDQIPRVQGGLGINILSPREDWRPGARRSA
jgi:small subunit ribosomal protein S8